jgi:hypothetical protein
MDIGELYDALDWSQARESLDKWMQEHLPDQAEAQEEEFDAPFMRQGRCWEIAYALPSEIVGQLPDWTPEIQVSARRALYLAGVWGQICDYLEKTGHLGGNKPSVMKREVEQLAIFAENEQFNPKGD